MMTLAQRLQDKKDAIVRRWLDDVLATYSPDAAAAFTRQKDRFANPVGHSLRVATRAIFEWLLEETDTDNEKIYEHLHEVIKIRAIQEFSTSDAVRFIFHLKKVVRAELGKAIEDGQHWSELTELEEKIDQVALAAFEIFVQCREQVYELRVNEARRSVSWVVDRMNRRGSDPETAQPERE